MLPKFEVDIGCRNCKRSLWREKAADLSLVLSFRQRIIYDGGVSEGGREGGSKGISDKEFRSLLLGSDKLAVRLTERAAEVTRPPPMHGLSKKAEFQDTALSTGSDR